MTFNNYLLSLCVIVLFISWKWHLREKSESYNYIIILPKLCENQTISGFKISLNLCAKLFTFILVPLLPPINLWTLWSCKVVSAHGGISFSHFPGGSYSKESACIAGDPGSVPGLGRFLEEWNDYPFQYSCLENAMDKGAWQATVHGVPKSQTWLSN